MKRILTLLMATLGCSLALAGCGGTACSSGAAQLSNGTASPSCSLQPGATATITVQLCQRCTDSSPSCQAEFVNGQLEIAPSIQQCAEQAGCAISGCNLNPSVDCVVAVPATLSSEPLVIVASDSQGSPVTLTGTVSSGSGTTCTL